MPGSRADYAFVQARLQARHGARPLSEDWSRIEAARSLDSFLAAAKASPLAPWVETIDPSGDIHIIEFRLRQQWRRYVDDLSRWQPERWRAATLWLKRLVDLPVIDHVLAGGIAPDWVEDDPALAPFAGWDPAARSKALADAGLALFDPANGAPRSAAKRWFAEWQRLCPAANKAAQAPALLVLLGLEDGGPRGLADREALRHRLIKLFRKGAGTSLAVCSHLALTFLDLERLRGGLARARLFEQTLVAEAS
ncbi:MAG: hypothetical protein C0606_16250 [Hyphomicrobiales bacterium]|nr:MAG: hypothetical protein C0606_16250 [Hyphomicrobiales bacterium]